MSPRADFNPTRTQAALAVHQRPAQSSVQDPQLQRLLDHVRVPKNFPGLYSGWDERQGPLPAVIQQQIDAEVSSLGEPPECTEMYTGSFEGRRLIAARIDWSVDDCTLLVTDAAESFLVRADLHGTPNRDVLEHWAVRAK